MISKLKQFLKMPEVNSNFKNASDSASIGTGFTSPEELQYREQVKTL